MGVVPFIVATAGHVDHGKSALVCALSGTDPDRLPEEKQRGITIDLGFAHIDLPGTGATYRVGIVDVPGHEDFVKNMVAGVGSIDLALLVVAADDGWMPQTEEHLQILTYLGVTRAVVALTKIDLVASDVDVRQQIRQKLDGTPLADAAIVGTSTVSAKGIDDLKTALATALAQIAPPCDIGKPRLSVDRAFILRGIGTVVTGTLTGGTLHRGQAVAVQPSGRPARIRTLQSYNQEIEKALPGSRVALNLPDLQVNELAHGAETVGRGDVITTAELGRSGDTLDVALEISPRAALPRPLKEATLVRFHHGSANTPAFIYFQGVSSVAPGQRVLAQLRLESSVFAFAGDHFILRDWIEQHTLAGGIVLDPGASRRGFRTDQRRQFLQARADRSHDVLTFVRTELARDGAAPKADLLVRSRFGAPEIEAALAQLAQEQMVVTSGALVADVQWWSSLRTRAVEAIDAVHRSHPQEAGLRLTDLRQSLSKHMGRADVFEAVVADLCQCDFTKTGVAIRRVGHRPALPPALQPAGAKLRAALLARPLDPPSRKELAPDPVSQQALRFLLQTGEAVELGEELVIAAECYHRAIDAVRTFLVRHGAATVSELKQTLNTSRRIMVPLVEKLDRDGITLRQGDKRILRTGKDRRE